MERTKGRVRVSGYHYLTPVGAPAVVIVTTLHKAGLVTEQQIANIEHLEFCWNAFEPDGIVSKLVDICETTLGFAEAGHKHTKTLLKNPRPTPGIDEFFIEVRAILAEAKESIK